MRRKLSKTEKESRKRNHIAEVNARAMDAYKKSLKRRKVHA